MFDDIKTTWKPFPFVSTVFTVCFTGVTLATIFFTNIGNSVGCFSNSCGIMQRLTVSFQHGFDEISALVHLLVDIILMIFIGSFTEKVMGNFRFFVLTVAAMFGISIVHWMFGLIGHGASSVIYAFTPIVMYSLSEGRLIKTRSAYDDYYRDLRNILVVIFVLLPVLFAFIPFNFNSKFTLLESVLYGNLANITGLLIGFLMLQIFRDDIRKRLKTVSRKKKFDPDIFESETRIATLLFPALILLALFFK